MRFTMKNGELKKNPPHPHPFIVSGVGFFVQTLPEIPLAVGLLRGGEDVVAQPAALQLVAALARRGRSEGGELETRRRFHVIHVVVRRRRSQRR